MAETPLAADAAKKPAKKAAQNPAPPAPVQESKPKDKALPKAVKLSRPYGFYDEAGDLRYWNQGAVVDTPSDIAVLIERGAPVEIPE